MKKTISLILAIFLLLSGCGKSSKLISPVDPAGTQTPIEPEITTPSESETKNEETTEQKPATNYWGYAWITTEVIAATAAIVGVVYVIYKFADMLESANIPKREETQADNNMPFIQQDQQHPIIDQPQVNDFENDISISEDQDWNSVEEEYVPEVAGNKAEKNRIGSTDNGMGLGHKKETADESTRFTTEDLFEDLNRPQPKPHKKDSVGGYHSSEEWDVSTDSGGKKVITDTDFFNLNNEEDELEPIIETTEIPTFTPDMMPRRREQVAVQKAALPDPFYDSPQMTTYTYPPNRKDGSVLTVWAGHWDLNDSGDLIYIPPGSYTLKKEEFEELPPL